MDKFLDEDNTAIYLFMQLKKKPDINRLKKAVELTCKIIPEILCRFDRAKSCFVKSEYSPDDLVMEIKSDDPLQRIAQIYPASGPMMRVIIAPNDAGYELNLSISHLLSDGGGLKEYAQLLCYFYNNPSDADTEKFKNVRDLQFLINNFNPQKLGMPPEVKKVLGKSGNISIRMNVSSENNYRQTNRVEIKPAEMEKIKEKARKASVTFNDLFLSSYICTLYKYSGEKLIVMGCPADLRAFFSDKIRGKLTITNFSSYYHVPIEMNEESAFDSVLRTVINSMNLQKNMHSCIVRFKAMYKIYGKFPSWLNKLILKMIVSRPKVLYSNTGIIDDTKVWFENNEITDCIINGSYNEAPGVRLTISTFNGKCTLSSNSIGTSENHLFISEMLEDMKQRIMEWSL